MSLASANWGERAWAIEIEQGRRRGIKMKMDLLFGPVVLVSISLACSTCRSAEKPTRGG